jgi:transcriptional regulator with XRE-family HTH domain
MKKSKKDNKNISIAVRMKHIRQALGLDKNDIVKETGVSAPTIRRIESGHTLPPSKYLIYLAQVRNVNLHYIFDDDREMFRPSVKVALNDFGIVKHDVDKMLRIMLQIPQVLYAVLAFFEGYLDQNKMSIQKSLSKAGKPIPKDN